MWDYKNKDHNDTEYADEFKKFLTKDGMVLFFLRMILNKNQSEDSRRRITYILQQNIENRGETYKKVEAWFPVQFLHMREKPDNTDEEKLKRAKLFIQNVDKENF